MDHLAPNSLLSSAFTSKHCRLAERSIDSNAWFWSDVATAGAANNLTAVITVFLRIKEHSPCAEIEGEKEQTMTACRALN
jgi:hypothetical protein